MLLALQPRCNKTLMLYNSTVSIELTLCKFTALIRLNLNLLLHCRRLEEWTLEEYNAKFYKVSIRYSANYVLLSLRYINWRFLELALESRCIDLMQSRRNVQKIDFMKAVIYTIGWVVFKAKAGSYKYTIMYVYIIEHFKSFVNFCSCFSSLRWQPDFPNIGK